MSNADKMMTYEEKSAYHDYSLWVREQVLCTSKKQLSGWLHEGVASE
jgi:hypothetical protein